MWTLGHGTNQSIVQGALKVHFLYRHLQSQNGACHTAVTLIKKGPNNINLAILTIIL